MTDRDKVGDSLVSHFRQHGVDLTYDEDSFVRGQVAEQISQDIEKGLSFKLVFKRSKFGFPIIVQEVYDDQEVRNLIDVHRIYVTPKEIEEGEILEDYDRLVEVITEE